MKMKNDSVYDKWESSKDFDQIHYGSEFWIKTFSGHDMKLKLNRTAFEIKSGPCNQYKEGISTIQLYSQEDFHYRMEFLRPDTDYSKIKFIRIKGAPFKLNGVLCQEAYIQKGDRVSIQFYQLNFEEKMKSNGDYYTKKIIELGLSLPKIQSQLPIYLLGETGTGKTFWAEKIHHMSGVSGPFVHLNLSAINPSTFESELFGHTKGAFTGAMHDKMGAIYEAKDGTLFLDEINSISKDLQVKLLLAIDNGKIRPVGASKDKKVHFRLITSSNEPLENLVREDRMRKDFYYRIQSGLKMNLPRLNSCQKYFHEVTNLLEEELDIIVTTHLRDTYLTLPWSGNIREYKQYLLKKKIDNGRRFYFDQNDEDLLKEKWRLGVNELQNFSTHEQVTSLEDLKRNYIRYMFEKVGKDVKKTSQLLQVSPNTIRTSVTHSQYQSM